MPSSEPAEQCMLALLVEQALLGMSTTGEVLETVPPGSSGDGGELGCGAFGDEAPQVRLRVFAHLERRVVFEQYERPSRGVLSGRIHQTRLAAGERGDLPWRVTHGTDRSVEY